MLLDPPPPVTNCHTFSDPLPPRALRTLWTAPNRISTPPNPTPPPSSVTYFMDGPQWHVDAHKGEVVSLMWTEGRGSKTRVTCGCHKWMTPFYCAPSRYLKYKALGGATVGMSLSLYFPVCLSICLLVGVFMSVCLSAVMGTCNYCS